MSKSKNKIVWISAIIIFVVIMGSLCAYYSNWIEPYYLNFKHNHYSYGDQLQIDDKYISKAESRGFPLVRLIKSGDTYDFDFNTSKKISGDKIKLLKTKIIGTYIDCKLVPMKNLENPGGKPFIGWLYAIKPNSELIEDTGMRPLGLKPGFTPVDDNYYIFNVDMLK